MPMPAFTSLLAELFTAHGWKTTQDAALEGRSGTVYGAPVLAENGDAVLLVERRGPDEAIAPDLIEEMARVVEDSGADGGLLAHLGPASAEARLAAAGRITLWDHGTLGRLIGETRLALAAGAPLPELPVEPGDGTDAGTEALPSSVADLMPPAFQDGPDLAALETLGDLLADAPTQADPTPPGAPPAAPPQPRTPPVEQGGDADTTYPALAPRLTPEQAQLKVRDRLFAAAGNADLVLQPVHLIDFECDLLIEGSLRYDTVEGRVEVHGTNKDVRDVDPLWLDPAKAAPVDRERARSVEERPLRISDERALELAHKALLRTHTRIVEIETSDPEEDFVIMERKDVAPRPDQVRLQHLGVVLRPHWRLRGTNGAALVDAITGEVVGEQLRNADPDAMVLD